MKATHESLHRVDDRAADALRPVRIEVNPLKYAEGSCLIEVGDTRVLVAASIENRVPRFLIDSGKGWATAEYSMLPRATSTRSQREVTRGRPSGRTAEIQRLIGRSLRAVLDLEKFPERTLTVDCDVLQADGGTRTASITGAYVAAVLALGEVFLAGDLRGWPVTEPLAAVSVGIVGNTPLLDLDAPEDQSAAVDMNVVATATGRLVEVQGTGEERSFSRQELDRLLDLAFAGIAELNLHQNKALAPVLEEIASVRSRGRHSAPSKNEADLWGRPE